MWDIRYAATKVVEWGTGRKTYSLSPQAHAAPCGGDDGFVIVEGRGKELGHGAGVEPEEAGGGSDR
ncbi:hypothetical protein AB0I60_32195 [Actinosynnema sp. NPDC050436]|uniref:hypothetical protein n=1 Tax=Actinosynnema sp. NPDC050436 TaxID=3155659 RepID=UPI0033DFD0EB